MSLTKKQVIRGLLLLLAFSSALVVRAIYVPTSRDTLPSPDTVTYDISEPNDMELLYETNNFKYFYRETRDTISIYDKRNNYTWMTGTDLEFSKDIDDECDDMVDRRDALDPEDIISDQMLLDACRNKEVKLNTTYTGFANSLVTIEYIDNAGNTKRV